MYKKLLLAVLAAATLLIASPAAAMATAIPGLPSGVDQAYIADGNGDPEGGTFTLSGAISINGPATMTCNVDATIDFFDDGTSSVTAFSSTGCVVNGWPNCTVTTTATSLGWGDRFGYDTNAGTFRDYIDVSLDITYSAGQPTCPFPALTFAKAGTFSPAISISGGVLSASFGSGSGNLAGPLGTETWNGTLSSSSGIGTDTQLIF